MARVSGIRDLKISCVKKIEEYGARAKAGTEES